MDVTLCVGVIELYAEHTLRRLGATTWFFVLLNAPSSMVTNFCDRRLLNFTFRVRQHAATDKHHVWICLRLVTDRPMVAGPSSVMCEVVPVEFQRGVDTLDQQREGVFQLGSVRPRAGIVMMPESRA